MTRSDLRALRRYVRRHSDVTRGAAMLFEEICDLHAERMGCIAGDPWLARQLNATERTIRSWRGELRELGVIEETRQDGQRCLIPARPDALTEQKEEGGGSKFPENRKETSGKPEANFRKNTSNRKQTSGKPENSFRKPASATENIYNSSLRSERGGEGRARVREDDPPEIKAFVEEVGRRPQVPTEYDEIVAAVDDVELFRRLCRTAYRNVAGKGHRVRVGYLLDDYEKALSKRTQSDEHTDQRSHSGAAARDAAPPLDYDYDQHIEPAR